MIDIDKYNIIFRKVFCTAMTIFLGYQLVKNEGWVLIITLPIIAFVVYIYCSIAIETCINLFNEYFGIKNWFVYVLVASLSTSIIFGIYILIGSCCGGSNFDDDYEYMEYKTRFL